MLLKHIPRDSVVKLMRPPHGAYTRFRDYLHSPRRIRRPVHPPTTTHHPTNTQVVYMFIYQTGTAIGRKKVSLNRRTFISRLIAHARIVINTLRRMTSTPRRFRRTDITNGPSVQYRFPQLFNTRKSSFFSYLYTKPSLLYCNIIYYNINTPRPVYFIRFLDIMVKSDAIITARP